MDLFKIIHSKPNQNLFNNLFQYKTVSLLILSTKFVLFAKTGTIDLEVNVCWWRLDAKITIWQTGNAHLVLTVWLCKMLIASSKLCSPLLSNSPTVIKPDKSKPKQTLCLTVNLEEEELWQFLQSMVQTQQISQTIQLTWVQVNSQPWSFLSHKEPFLLALVPEIQIV